ncbi:MAG: ketol-acid reductoisomerase [Coriobacteriia bacterium]|nr:ketol-acid reductoisomerase [Coriobacteriia bacterium]MCL2745682.1 ketol-acid reductoisomerase [Coriobacteriia bacterium]MCL2871361.1 ketol-acid reductoisomerase [Coriobacteriia bacterium]
MANMFYEKDCNIEKLDGKTIAIIGYGSQGHAHALNLRDSGINVIIGARENGKGWSAAEADGFSVMTTAEAAKAGDIIMLLVGDEMQQAVYENDIAPNLTAGKALAFAHGFNVHYKQIVPSAEVDVFLAAPKGPGHTVRGQFMAGKGVPSLVAVHQDATGNAKEIALAYIAGIGGARAGVLETTFTEETETDLFGEQAVLCGGVVDLMRCGFEVLTEAGYSPESAYLEVIHELKLIIDLVNKAGVSGMNYSISNTAEYGEYVSGPRVLPAEETKARMREVLADVQDGSFAEAWIEENKNSLPNFLADRAALENHPMEVVGRKLREKMLWQGDDNLDTASN